VCHANESGTVSAWVTRCLSPTNSLGRERSAERRWDKPVGRMVSVALNVARASTVYFGPRPVKLSNARHAVSKHR
jgi:hypothetical protein